MVQAHKILEKTKQCQTCDFPGREVVTGGDKGHVCWPILWVPQSRHFSVPIKPQMSSFCLCKNIAFHKVHEFSLRQATCEVPTLSGSHFPECLSFPSPSLEMSVRSWEHSSGVTASPSHQAGCFPQIHHLFCVSSPSRTCSSITQNGTLLLPPAV